MKNDNDIETESSIAEERRKKIYLTKDEAYSVFKELGIDPNAYKKAIEREHIEDNQDKNMQIGGFRYYKPIYRYLINKLR